MRLIDANLLMTEFASFVKDSNNSDFAKAPTWNDAVALLESAPTIDTVKHGQNISEKSTKKEETTKKESIIDHKFLEKFECIMKKDISMREKAAELVDKVIVHGPALIVFWMDGGKTVVKCTNEEFDLEKGIAMAFIKRMFGNKGNYNAFLKFIINFWTY